MKSIVAFALLVSAYVVLADDCTDNELRCVHWAKTGECSKNSDWMKKNCAGSCNKDKCDQVTIKVKKCQDDPSSASQCAGWKSSGECSKNEGYMVWKCTRTCGFCADSSGGSSSTQSSAGSSTQSSSGSGSGSSSSGSGSGSSSDADCTDHMLRCNFWASTGECKKNSAFMMQKCKGSCNEKCDQVVVKVQKCQDDPSVSQCSKWQAAGFCERNLGYMIWKCTKTCGFCDSGSSSSSS